MRLVFKPMGDETMEFVSAFDDAGNEVDFGSWEAEDGESHLVFKDPEYEWNKHAHEFIRLVMRGVFTKEDQARYAELAKLVDTVL